MRKVVNVWGTILTGLVLASATRAADPAWDVRADTWSAMDGLGRELPDERVCPPVRPDRKVGIFYFLWQEGQNPIYDISKLRAKDPQNPAYGPPGSFHYWGEPLFGYYRADDEWVIRKHAQMLSDAGVDVLVFDVTNGLIYERNFLAVCRVLDRMRHDGLKVPQISFLANSAAPRVVAALSQSLYAKQLFPATWFYWKGKPLMMAASEDLAPSIKSFFTLRQSWAWTDPNGWFKDGRDKWPWLDHTPQKFGWHESPSKAEEIAVSTAEHATSNMGRSFKNGRQPVPGAFQSERGLYFDEQWRRALEVDPEFVFVTGWNEWIAQRFLNEGGTSMLGRKLAKGETFFVDQYSQEYSRDVEPMTGGHGDAYYYQMTSFIRRYKGVRAPVPVVSAPIRLDGQFGDWEAVGPEFRDTIGDVAHRNHPGWKGEPGFTNQTGRNDLKLAKVSLDATNAHFYLRCAGAIQPATTEGLLLFIDTDANPKTGWLGYDFVVNRTPAKEGRLVVEHAPSEHWAWVPLGSAEYVVNDSQLELTVPRELLRLGPSAGSFRFKWADNISRTGLAEDFTLNGDSAPNDRFSYRAILHPAAAGRR